MSKLLLDEKPIVVLPSLARAVGINGAVILQQLHYWLQRSNNLKEGYIWRYQSYEGWAKELGWISAVGVRKLIAKLESENLIVSSNFNTLSFDKTKWYRINYEHPLLAEKLENNHGQTMRYKVSDDEIKSIRPSDTKCATIPESTTEHTTQNTTHNTREAKSPLSCASDENFEKFWAMYLKKSGKKDALKAWRKIKPEMHREILDKLEVLNRVVYGQRAIQYVPMPATWLNGERWNDNPIPEAGCTVKPLSKPALFNYDDDEPPAKNVIVVGQKAINQK